MSFCKIIGFTKRIYHFYSWLHRLRNTQGKIHGTYLGNIYGIYTECITNISIDIYDKTIDIHQYIHQTHRRRLRRPPHWVCVSDGYIDGYVWLYHKYLWIYYLYIPYIFPRYVPCIFPCVFLNLWSQEKRSPYRKTTFLLLFVQISLLTILSFFIKVNDFLNNIRPIWAHKGPY